MHELWLPVVGAEPWYEVSSYGRVRSVDRVLVMANGKRRPHRGVMLTLFPRDTGYLGVTLGMPGGQTNFNVHNLVAKSFLDGSPGADVNHKNLDKHDNRASNLEYLSTKGNINHAVQLGVFGAASLMVVEVYEMRRLHKRGFTQNALGSMFGIHPSQVSRVVNRRCWKLLLES